MFFQGKSAIVTGAGRGLGKSHVLCLAKQKIAGILINDFVPEDDHEGLKNLHSLKSDL